MMGTFAQFERRMIGQRTKDALKVKKAQGVRLGRPIVRSPEVAGRIATASSGCIGGVRRHCSLV
jgi:DNA invertase Pin-like site-specific DNA recombinase